MHDRFALLSECPLGKFCFQGFDRLVLFDGLDQVLHVAIDRLLPRVASLGQFDLSLRLEHLVARQRNGATRKLDEHISCMDRLPW